MKTIKLLAWVVGICVIISASTLFAQDAALKVAGFEGKVQVKIAPSTEWVDATVGQPLNTSDAIRTGENGQTMLQFSDKSTVALKQNTEVVVEELVWNDTARKAGLNMPSGELRAIIKKMNASSDFKVKTPAAICGARGTIFYIISTGTETRVFVTEGAVDFTNPASGNSYVVVENMAAISELSGSMTEPRELTGEEKEQALAGWSGVIGETYTDPTGGEGGTEGGDMENQGGTGENPGVENKGLQESSASPI